MSSEGIEHLRLPQDLVTFLRGKRELVYEPEHCECGAVKLVALEEITLSAFYVDSENAPWVNQDPHAGKYGYYSVPGVNLVVACDGYDPDGILIWLPDVELFGTWDCDHWNLLIFPSATWADIVADPVKYLNAQWRLQENITEFLIPTQRFSFHPGRPWDSK